MSDDGEDDDWWDSPPVLVVDNGSFMMKAGFAGDDAPRAVFPTIVGRPRHPNIMVGMGPKDAYVGDEAQAKRGILTLTNPIEYGVITNFDDLEKIWHHSWYNELCVAPEEHEVLITDRVNNSKSNRERMIKILFETFNIPAAYLSDTSRLALYASGRLNGIVVDSGSVTQIAPICEGYTLTQNTKTLKIGGNHITEYMMQLLSEKGYAFVTVAEKEIVRDIKEKISFIAKNYNEELINIENSCDIDKSYELPDGQIIDSNATKTVRFKAPECLFKPGLIGMDCNGIDELIYETIMDVWKYQVEVMDIVENIVLSGGCTMFEGLQNRLTVELSKKILINDKLLVDGYLRNSYKKFLYQDIVNVMYKYVPKRNKIIAPPERKYSVWIGGSIQASLRSFQKEAISKCEYDENGPSIVHRKCI